MTAIGDVFQVVVKGELFAQVATRNVFYYELTSNSFAPGAILSDNLAAGFQTKFFPGPGSGLQSDLINDAQTWLGFTIIDLFDDTDFWDTVFSPVKTGNDLSAEVMPPYVAYDMRSPWLGPGFRRARKRFGGVPEAGQNEGKLIAGSLTALQTLANLVAQPITDTVGAESATWYPVQVGRIEYITSKGTKAWRLPENQGESRTVVLPSMQAQENLTTQNTRKYGRGI